MGKVEKVKELLKKIKKGAVKISKIKEQAADLLDEIKKRLALEPIKKAIMPIVIKIGAWVVLGCLIIGCICLILAALLGLLKALGAFFKRFGEGFKEALLGTAMKMSSGDVQRLREKLVESGIDFDQIGYVSEFYADNGYDKEAKDNFHNYSSEIPCDCNNNYVCLINEIDNAQKILEGVKEEDKIILYEENNHEKGISGYDVIERDEEGNDISNDVSNEEEERSTLDKAYIRLMTLKNDSLDSIVGQYLLAEVLTTSAYNPGAKGILAHINNKGKILVRRQAYTDEGTFSTINGNIIEKPGESMLTACRVVRFNNYIDELNKTGRYVAVIDKSTALDIVNRLKNLLGNLDFSGLLNAFVEGVTDAVHPRDMDYVTNEETFKAWKEQKDLEEDNDGNVTIGDFKETGQNVGGELVQLKLTHLIDISDFVKEYAMPYNYPLAFHEATLSPDVGIKVADLNKYHNLAIGIFQDETESKFDVKLIERDLDSISFTQEYGGVTFKYGENTVEGVTNVIEKITNTGGESWQITITVKDTDNNTTSYVSTSGSISYTIGDDVAITINNPTAKTNLSNETGDNGKGKSDDGYIVIREEGGTKYEIEIFPYRDNGNSWKIYICDSQQATGEISEAMDADGVEMYFYEAWGKTTKVNLKLKDIGETNASSDTQTADEDDDDPFTRFIESIMNLGDNIKSTFTNFFLDNNPVISGITYMSTWYATTGYSYKRVPNLEWGENGEKVLPLENESFFGKLYKVSKKVSKFTTECTGSKRILNAEGIKEMNRILFNKDGVQDPYDKNNYYIDTSIYYDGDESNDDRPSYITSNGLMKNEDGTLFNGDGKTPLKIETCADALVQSLYDYYIPSETDSEMINSAKNKEGVYEKIEDIPKDRQDQGTGESDEQYLARKNSEVYKEALMNMQRPNFSVAPTILKELIEYFSSNGIIDGGAYMNTPYFSYEEYLDYVTWPFESIRDTRVCDNGINPNDPDYYPSDSEDDSPLLGFSLYANYDLLSPIDGVITRMEFVDEERDGGTIVKLCYIILEKVYYASAIDELVDPSAPPEEGGAAIAPINRKTLFTIQLAPIYLNTAGDTVFEFDDNLMKEVRAYLQLQEGDELPDTCDGLNIYVKTGDKLGTIDNSVIDSGVYYNRFNSAGAEIGEDNLREEIQGMYDKVRGTYDVQGLSLVGKNFYFNQGSTPWGGKMYSSVGDPNQTYASSACGPTALAIAISNTTRNPKVTPEVIGNFALNNNYRTANNGTSNYLFINKTLLGGLGVECIENSDVYNSDEKKARLFEYLQNGYYAVILQQHYVNNSETSGHYIALGPSDDPNYKFVVLDPYSGEKFNGTTYEDIQAAYTGEVVTGYYNSLNDFIEARGTKVISRYWIYDSKISVMMDPTDSGIIMPSEQYFTNDKTGFVEVGGYKVAFQSNDPWGTMLYTNCNDQDQTYRSSGCGPASFATIVTNILQKTDMPTNNEKYVTPNEIGSRLVLKGYRRDEGGTDVSGALNDTDFCNSIGLPKYVSHEKYSATYGSIPDGVKTMISNGYIVEIRFRHKAGGGHYLVFAPPKNGGVLTVLNNGNKGKSKEYTSWDEVISTVLEGDAEAIIEALAFKIP